jgi:alcohol dehydrogenase (cytochrome c)
MRRDCGTSHHKSKVKSRKLQVRAKWEARAAAAGAVLAGALGVVVWAQQPAAPGEAIFNGKGGCATCHEVNGRGGITGPDLSTAARYDAAALRRKIVEPDQPIAVVNGPRGPVRPQTVVARTRDGRELRGLRRSEDTFTLQIVDATGRLQVLDKTSLVSVRTDDVSLMPHDYAARLTPDEITSLVSYLSTLRQRDPSRAPVLAGGVTPQRLANAVAEPQNWLTYWGSYQSTHYSPLTQITPANVARLRTAWAFAMPGDAVLQTTPLVVDGVMYATQPGTVAALDARTGRPIWRYTRTRKVRNPNEINPFNRGAAIAGQRLFVGTLDAALVALDARTGTVLWETQVADSLLGYSITSAPLVVKDEVLVGITGGEFGARGFLDAYDIATGRRLWRWNAVPAPGDFGSETWKGDSWQHGGSPMWLTGSYDPALNTVYWTVGNPGPQIDRSARGDLDNLFSDSVVAIDPDTGTRKWHYQFTPNDGHDWDSTEAVMLVDRVWHGQMRKLLLHADRNGIFYVLDRTSGRFLAGTPFVYQNWNTGFGANGRPLVVAGSNSSAEGSFFVYPTAGGATNWQAPSYSPLTGLVYLEYSESGQRYVSSAPAYEAGRQYIGRAPATGPAVGPRAGEPSSSAGIKAIDPETGRTAWDFKIAQGSLQNGVLATGSNVVFASIRDGNVAALDARTGQPLWHFQTGGPHAAAPISYAIGGRQYVTLAAGNTIYTFSLPD